MMTHSQCTSTLAVLVAVLAVCLSYSSTAVNATAVDPKLVQERIAKSLKDAPNRITAMWLEQNGGIKSDEKEAFCKQAASSIKELETNPNLRMIAEFFGTADILKCSKSAIPLASSIKTIIDSETSDVISKATTSLQRVHSLAIAAKATGTLTSALTSAISAFVTSYVASAAKPGNWRVLELIDIVKVQPASLKAQASSAILNDLIALEDIAFVSMKKVSSSESPLISTAMFLANVGETSSISVKDKVKLANFVSAAVLARLSSSSDSEGVAAGMLALQVLNKDVALVDLVRTAKDSNSFKVQTQPLIVSGKIPDGFSSVQSLKVQGLEEKQYQFSNQVVSFDSSLVTPGIYKVTLSMKNGVSALVKVRIGLDLDLSKPLVLTKKGAKDVSVTYPNKITESRSVERGQALSISFTLLTKKGDAFIPQQAFVKLTNTLTGNEVDFVTTKVSKASGQHEINVILDSNPESFKFQTGAYKVEVVISDSALLQPIRWLIENLQVMMPPIPIKKNLPLYYETLTHESEVAIGVLPEKFHTFRQPDRRPAQVVSYAFTVLIIALLVASPVVMLVQGANLGAFSVKPILFLGNIAVLLLLFSSFWLGSFTMFQALGYSTPLCITLGTLGYFGALSSVESKAKLS